jgi:hypothetical protein
MDWLCRSLLLGLISPFTSGCRKASGDGLVDGQLRGAEVAATALYRFDTRQEEG